VPEIVPTVASSDGEGVACCAFNKPNRVSTKQNALSSVGKKFGRSIEERFTVYRKRPE